MRAMRIKYRIGVMPGPWATGPDGVDLFWRFIDLCENTDIDSVWFSERLTSPQPVLEPMTTMAAVAARTRRLKFGPSVLIAPFRSPVLLARELAMIDYLSGGRMLPAVGVGAEQDREFRASGIPVKERGRRTDETIRILRRCWAEDEVTFDGEFWQLDRITVLPKPRQQPFPLWIGGNTEVAMRRTGQLGDGWIPSFITPEAFAAGVVKTRAFAAAAGREVPADHFGVLIYFAFAPDRATARAVATPFVPRNRIDDATLEQSAAFGPPGLLVERLEQYVRGGASKFIVRPMVPHDRMLDHLARLAEDVVPIFHAR
jgi:probable F420-dependent oxidoreductase